MIRAGHWFEGDLALCPFPRSCLIQFECEDVEGDGDLLDGLGVGLGRQEMYAAMLAVKRLGEDAKRCEAAGRARAGAGWSGGAAGRSVRLERLDARWHGVQWTPAIGARVRRLWGDERVRGRAEKAGAVTIDEGCGEGHGRKSE